MDNLWTYNDVAEFLGCSTRRVKELVRTNQIPYIRFCKRITRFDSHEVQAWVKSRRAGILVGKVAGTAFDTVKAEKQSRGRHHGE